MSFVSPLCRTLATDPALADPTWPGQSGDTKAIFGSGGGGSIDGLGGPKMTIMSPSLTPTYN